MGRSKVEYYVNKLCTIWSLLLTNSIQSTTETHSSQTIQKEISFFFFFILNYKKVFTIPNTLSYHLSVAVVEHKPSEAEVVVDNKVVDNIDHFD